MQALSRAMDLAPTNKAVSQELQQVKGVLTLEQLAQVWLCISIINPSAAVGANVCALAPTMARMLCVRGLSEWLREAYFGKILHTWLQYL